MAKLANQGEVLRLMREGWELASSMTMEGGFWIQQGGAGYGGKAHRVHAATANALYRKKLIRCVERKFPTARWALASMGAGP